MNRLPEKCKMLNTKNLTKIGYADNVERSIAITAGSRHCKRRHKEDVLTELADVMQNPADDAGHEIWGRLPEHFCPQSEGKMFPSYQLRDKPLYFRIYGGKPAMQQMELVMRLPVAVQGALMPDAHTGYGLPVGGALAVENAVILFRKNR